MKKIRNFIIILMPIILALSCEIDSFQEKDIDSDLYIALPEAVPKVAYTNKPITFSAKAFAKSGIAKIEVKVDYETIDDSILTPENISKQIEYPFSYTPTNEDLDETLSFVLVVEDKNGFTSTTEYDVKVVLEPAIIEFSFPENLPDTLNIGDLLEFDIQVTSEDELKKIETIYNSTEIVELTKENFDNPYVATYKFSYEILPENGGREISFIFKATDIEDKFKEENFNLFIKGQAYPKVMTPFNDITLGMQNNSEIGQFIDLKTSMVYSVPNAKLMSSEIDLGTFRSGSSGINLFAPSNSPAAQFIYNNTNEGEDWLGSWNVRNNTELRKISSDLISIDDFNSITDDRLVIEAFENSEPSSSGLNRLEEGDIIAFKTADGLYGIIQLKTIESSSSGKLTFDYKIQGSEFIIPVNAYSNVKLGMQNNNEVGPFINLESNTVYFVPDAKINSSEIDLGIFRSGSSGINLFAPSFSPAAQFIYNDANWADDKLGNWPVRNNTELRKVASSDLTVDGFNSISDGQDIIRIFDQSGNSSNGLNKLIKDDIIAFKNSNGSHGILLIKSSEEAGFMEGNMIIDYKIQQF